MKNTLSHRWLIAIVISIWGSVLVRFWDGCNPPEEVSGASEDDLSIIPVIEFHDTVKLLLDYDDPFIRGRSLMKTESFPADEGILTRPVPPPPQIPQFEFLGAVSRGEPARATGIVRLEGRQLIVQAGDSLAGKRVKGITREKLLFYP